MNESNNPKHSPSFPQFSRLPTELRLRIWTCFNALTSPRIIPIFVTVPVYFYPDLDGPTCFSWPHVFYNSQSIPPVLHINREARNLALEDYKRGIEVSQCISSNGSWWRASEPGEYKLCQHEIEARDQWDKLGDYLYWDRRKDVLLLESTKTFKAKSASIWSGKCDIKFESIRWLGIPYDMFEIWVNGISTNTVWTGMEDIFVILDEIDKQENIGSVGRWTKKSFGLSLREKIKGTWVGTTAGEAPQVTVVESVEEMTQEIEKRM